MERAILKTHVERLLSTHAPAKARDLSTILTEEFGIHVDRSTVNSILYQLKKQGAATVSNAKEWSLVGQNQHSDRKPAVSHTAEPRADHGLGPEFTLTEDQRTIAEIAADGHLLVRGQAGSGKTTVLAARAGRIVSAFGKVCDLQRSFQR